MLKNPEITGMEKIGLVTPTPGLSLLRWLFLVKFERAWDMQS